MAADDKNTQVLLSAADCSQIVVKGLVASLLKRCGKNICQIKRCKHLVQQRCVNIVTALLCRVEVRLHPKTATKTVAPWEKVKNE